MTSYKQKNVVFTYPSLVHPNVTKLPLEFSDNIRILMW